MAVRDNLRGGSSGNDSNIRYNEENNMIQIYANETWLDWEMGIINDFNFLTTISSDWTCQEMSVTPSSNGLTIATNGYSDTTYDTSFNAIYHCPKIIQATDKLKLAGSYNYVGGQGCYVYISTDGGNTWTLGASIETSTFDKTIDLSSYSDKQITVKIHIRAVNTLLTAAFNKFEISA